MTDANEIASEGDGFVGAPAERLLFTLARRLRVGRLVLQLPSGASRILDGAMPGPIADLRLRRWRAVGRLLTRGGVGLGEGYMDGDWDTHDLPALLALAGLNRNALAPRRLGHPLRYVGRLVDDVLRVNSRGGARRNIMRHYDLGNAFYRQWLDDTMTYSAAIFARPDDDIAMAQANKYCHMAAMAQVGPDHRVLEIGCGWGGFALWLARNIGCRVTAITISDAQYAFAAAQVQRAGLGDRVTVRRQDYRDVGERFDRILSIEMFEAVGSRYWRVFFAKLRDSLPAGGRAALQVITIAEDAVERYRHGVDFVQKYIFPGGMLPSTAALQREVAEAKLVWRQNDGFGSHYGKTLAIWGRRFDEAWPGIVPLGFDERFRRMWRYYLAYCEAGFRIGQVDVRQIAIERP